MVHLVTVVSHPDNAALTMMKIRVLSAYATFLVNQARVHISRYIVAVVNEWNPCRYVVADDEVNHECDELCQRFSQNFRRDGK